MAILNREASGVRLAQFERDPGVSRSPKAAYALAKYLISRISNAPLLGW